MVANKLSKTQVIIQNVDENLVIDNKDLSSIICDILSSYQYMELQFNVLSGLIKYGRSLENKLKLFLLQFDKLSHEQITNLLNKLGGHYSEIAINGKRPSLQKTSPNIELIDKLKEIGYISSFTEKEETIKVNTKNG
jgi:hypothetical protein